MNTDVEVQTKLKLDRCLKRSKLDVAKWLNSQSESTVFEFEQVVTISKIQSGWHPVHNIRQWTLNYIDLLRKAGVLECVSGSPYAKDARFKRLKRVVLNPWRKGRR